jgi:hypothetical protein
MAQHDHIGNHQRKDCQGGDQCRTRWGRRDSDGPPHCREDDGKHCSLHGPGWVVDEHRVTSGDPGAHERIAEAGDNRRDRIEQAEGSAR